ncbi:hypothetical protein N2K95_03505 [Arthrobacter zhaoxinii]|uniref:Uncharacterized protein n=1 Tax=Arthrobacter zhaoxinii TaxID=2964616 RepID=A0ABY5YSZ0_9MICC|nr:hypothetical protein [Arthrobacter zhaoxinii]UWX97763.1 hypothetical protein N2K95_03505 [Arthrobacter zhaoxinii]
MDWIWDVLGPAGGVLIGFGAGWGTRRSRDRRHESRALNQLITDLHLKRTLAPIDPHPAPAGPAEARHRSAVQDLRENITETLGHLEPGSGATEVLMRMAAVCNRYLRDVAKDPERYQFGLMELRQNLDEDLRILTDGRRDVQYLSPGEAPPGKRVPPPPPSRAPSASAPASASESSSSSSGKATRPKRTPRTRR